jgi:hypothetical protein
MQDVSRRRQHSMVSSSCPLLPQCCGWRGLGVVCTVVDHIPCSISCPQLQSVLTASLLHHPLSACDTHHTAQASHCGTLADRLQACDALQACVCPSALQLQLRSILLFYSSKLSPRSVLCE